MEISEQCVKFVKKCVKSDLTKKTLKWRHWCCSVVFIGNFEQTSYIVLVYPLLALNKLMLTEVFILEPGLNEKHIAKYI